VAEHTTAHADTTPPDQAQQERAREERQAAFVRAVVQTAVDGIITINERGLIEGMNAAVERLFGYTEAELLGQNIDTLMPPPYREQHNGFLARYLATGTGRVIGNVLELPGLRKDGSIFPMSLAVSEVHFSGQRYCTGIVHDISERKRTEAALRASEEMLRSLGDNLPNGVVFQAHDAPDGKRSITHVSAGCEALFEFTPEEVRAHPALYYERMLEEDRPRALEVEATSKRQQTTFDIEFRIVTRNGTVKWLHGRARPRRLPDGSTIWEGIFLDVSQRKRIEQELSEHAARMALSARVSSTFSESRTLRDILQRCAEELAAHFGAAFARIWTLNEAEAVLELQASAGMYTHLHGPHSRVPVGQWKIGLIAQERTPHLTNQVIGDPRISDQEWARREGMVAFAGYPLLADERVVGVMALFARRRLDEGSLESLKAISRAVALGIERKKTEEETRQAKEEADQANRAKSEFLSRMSHELRTPLNAILGFAQLLELSNPSPRQRGQIEQILKGGRHLLTLINEVLDLASIEAGRIELSVEPINVHNLFHEVLDLIRPLASQRGISLRVYPELDAAAHVKADNQRLKQVLLNLVSNAVKYNVERGSVELSCQDVDPGFHRLTVTDSGPGITPENLKRLFTPFDRLGAETTTVEGSGLGLVLSKRLVEAMGGKLGVASTPGRGTTFWVDLARARAIEEPSGEVGHSALVAEDGLLQHPCTVLYVEDNLDNLRLVEGILAYRPKVKLLSGLQGRLALDLARQHHPDLILLDVHLPDMKGDEVLRQLRAEPALRDIPVVVISADATANQIARLRAAGADDYLTKPIDVVRFLAVVDDCLKRKMP
jgi:PAS domain S-box-containing protein